MFVISPPSSDAVMKSLLLGLLIAAATGSAMASDRDVALALAREGRCEVALEALSALGTLSETDPRVARRLGECALRLEHFRQAAEALEVARRLEPDAPSVDLHLAIAYFHLGNHRAAAEALSRAREKEADRPEFLLYSGLLAIESDDFDSAVRSLDAASRLSDRSVEPVASFHLGRALAQTGEQKRAKAAFERVKREFPDSEWAEAAERALSTLREESGITTWGSFELGFEYDDNALLRGRGVGRPEEVSGQSDERGYWYLDAGALFLDRADWSGGLTARYGGTENNELERFDTHAPGGSLWLDRALGDATLRLQYDFDAAWIDSDPFVLSHLVSLSLFEPWSSGGSTVLSVAVGVDDYRYDRVFVPDGALGQTTGDPCADPTRPCSPFGVDEIDETDRDGTGLRFGLFHHEPLPFENDWFKKPWIEGEYRYSRYWSEGREYDHQRHQVEIGAGIELPLALMLSVAGRYAYVPYDHPSVFPDPSDVVVGRQYLLDSRDRREHETGVRVRIERAFGEHVVVSTRWSRTRNRSTADVFDYTRDLFGFSIRVGLGG